MSKYTEVHDRIQEAKDKMDAVKPASTPSPATTVKDKADVILYLEDKVASLDEENRLLKQLLMLYGEHAGALWELTTQVFNQEQQTTADTPPEGN